MKIYQIQRAANDINGAPRKLLITWDDEGDIIAVIAYTHAHVCELLVGFEDSDVFITAAAINLVQYKKTIKHAKCTRGIAFTQST